MSLRALRQDVWEGMRAAPGRHVLALLALFIGLSVLTLGVALLRGLDRRARTIEADFGARSFALPSPGGGRLSTRHEEVVRAALPDGVVASVRAEPAASAAGMPGVSITAVGAELAEVKGWTVLAGRFLDEPDVRGRARVAVLSSDLQRRTGRKPGDVIDIGRDPFVIVGVVETGGTPEDGVWSTTGERVFLPHSTPGSWHEDPADVLRADALLARPASGVDGGSALAAAVAALSSPPESLTGIEPVTASALSRRARELQRSIAWAAGGMAALSLLLGGAVLGSLMAASVAGRVTEIGLRRAIGATPGDIVLLFVAEGLLLCVAALGLALAAALGLLAVAGPRLPLPVEAGWMAVWVPALVALGTGILATAAPALHAARIAPAEALRAD